VSEEKKKTVRWKSATFSRFHTNYRTMFTQENFPSCTASVVNVKHAVRKKLLMDNGIMTRISKKTVYEMDGYEFKSFCFVIFLFDSTSFFWRAQTSV
jgi:hypothetical protein